jgi:putative ABC transport system permease protein
LAGVLWPGQDPVGRKLTRGGDDLYEVIGVVGDVRAEAHKAPVAMVYRTYWEWAPRSVVLVARAEGDPRSIAGAVRAAVRAVDADVPIAKIRTMQQILEDSVAARRFQMTLAAVFAGTALLLAALGIYGVVSYSVARRTNEMGIRMALGAESLHLYSMVLRQGMAPVALGLVAGVAGSLAAGRVLASLLYEISARDPLTIGAVAILLTQVALAACTLPARRATRVDPLVALRYE